MTLKHHHALVTGGARRIGRAICLGLAREGNDITVHYNQSAAEAEETVEKIEEHGVRAQAVQLDLSASERVRELIPEAQDRGGPVDILVNNASIFDHTSFRETSDEHWDKHMQVNLSAPVQLMRSFIEHHDGDGEGRIVNLLDWRHKRPRARQFAYSVAKTGLAGATKAAAEELAPNITVNGVAPGPILPPENEEADDLEHVISNLPAGRWGDVDDVVKAVLFFVRVSNFVTGEILHVDGGRQIM